MNDIYRKRIFRLVLIIVLSLTVIISSCLFIVTHSRYVTEMGGTGSDIGGQDNDLDNEITTPFNVGSPLDLFNAIESGYHYVRLSEDLTAPIIMTGDSLDLKTDLVIDLYGNEIQRSSRAGLVTVTEGAALTIIDTKGGGGLYNPTGNVLAIDGGDLNVFGGKFESGPRPQEYYSSLKPSDSKPDELKQYENALYSDIEIGAVNPIKCDSATMPLLPVRTDGKGNLIGGNVYFDSGLGNIKSDTYCYVAVNDKQLGETNAFDVSEAAFVYSYTYNGQTVTVFGFEEVVAAAEKEKSDGANFAGKNAYYNFAAVQMMSGKLNVNVNKGAASTVRASEDGSFYSYFGKQHSSCVYMSGGEMKVSTTGTFATVDPGKLPAGTEAKRSEGSCIISERLENTASGGVLDITRLGAAYTYNGSVIAMRGGTLNVVDANFVKTATISHTDDPRPLDDLSIDKSAMDAAIFMRGGRVDVENCTFTVQKELLSSSTGKTTYGILARGTNSEETIQTDLKCIDTTFIIHGSDSYGIYATRGSIDVVRGNITITSGSNSFGVYAVNMGSAPEAPASIGDAVDLKLDGTTIDIAKSGYQPGTKDLEFKTYVGENPQGMGEFTVTYPDGSTEKFQGRATSVGVYLNSVEDEANGTKPGGKVTINAAVIRSQGMGVAVNGGDLTFTGGAKIDAYNATAIGVHDGKLTFEDSAASYDVRCEINRKSNGVSGSAQFDVTGRETECDVSDATLAKDAATHQYNIYVPWQRQRDPENGEYTYSGVYENNNGIRVQGGKFICKGMLNLSFRGLYNDYELYNLENKPVEDTVYFDNLVIKSFAVACFDGQINIERCNIVSAVGGGVKVQGGEIVLGKEGGVPENQADFINIETRGRAHYGKRALVASHLSTSAYAGWRFYPNLSGGAAIVSRSGNITVNYGNFAAEYGNAVTATSDVTSAQENTARSQIVIKDGIFNGNLNHGNSSHGDAFDENEAKKEEWWVTKAGPASHYGVQVMGSADIDIYAGTFNGRNGGLCVRGKEGQANALVNIYAGTFGTSDTQDGINIFEYSTVNFGAYTERQMTDLGLNSDKEKQALIKTYAKFFPIALNPIFIAPAYGDFTQTSWDSQVRWNYNYNINVYVYYGTYMIADAVNTRGIGAVDSNIRHFNFFVYNHGTLVADQTTTNRNLIRFLAYKEIRENSYDDYKIKYGYTRQTHYYIDSENITGVTENPEWKT